MTNKKMLFAIQNASLRVVLRYNMKWKRNFVKCTITYHMILYPPRPARCHPPYIKGQGKVLFCDSFHNYNVALSHLLG